MNKLETIEAAINRGEGCLGKAAADEPVFVLRAKDIFAADLIREWADHVERVAALKGELTGARKAKIAEARKLAIEMETWRHSHDGGKVPD